MGFGIGEWGMGWSVADNLHISEHVGVRAETDVLPHVLVAYEDEAGGGERDAEVGLSTARTGTLRLFASACARTMAAWSSVFPSPAAPNAS